MSSIIFNQPWLLLLALLPILVMVLIPSYKQKALAIRIPFFQLAAQASGEQAARGINVYKKPKTDFVIGSLVWLCLVVAIAEPILLGATTTKTISSRDIMLAVDLSGSMDEKDFPTENGAPIQRLQAVKNVLTDFIQQRENDRIGIIVFGTKAYLQVPFTQDLTSTIEILNDSSVSMAGPHTAIGDAIGLAIKTFSQSNVENKVLILLTDGADTGSRMSPLNAAHIAKEEGLSIYTIGIGDENGQGQYRVDFATLKQVSATTNAQFYAATDSDSLATIYQQIDQIAQADIESTSSQAKTAVLHIPLIGAAVLAVLGLVITLVRIKFVRRYV